LNQLKESRSPMYDQAMKYIAFRFDIDTHKCIQVGVPNLIRLATELDTPFTFFINMGRGTSRRNVIKKIFFPGNGSTTLKTQKLSNLNKLGLWNYLVMALVNPRVGASHPNIIRKLDAAGHEIGLHGGSNHGLWQNESHNWEKERFLEEVNSALNSLARLIGKIPAGFSSPGWQGSEKLHSILESLGFLYVADAHGQNLTSITHAEASTSLLQVPTNILGKSGGIAYLENLRAREMDDKAILNDFSTQLNGKSLAIVYDHPYFAGIRELPILKEMVGLARSKGFQVVTLETLVKNSNI
jgi:peptidoglycan/xylan/chitin deacetylase (PgdA/CDA1 family)